MTEVAKIGGIFSGQDNANFIVLNYIQELTEEMEKVASREQF